MVTCDFTWRSYFIGLAQLWLNFINMQYNNNPNDQLLQINFLTFITHTDTPSSESMTPTRMLLKIISSVTKHHWLNYYPSLPLPLLLPHIFLPLYLLPPLCSWWIGPCQAIELLTAIGWPLGDVPVPGAVDSLISVNEKWECFSSLYE